MKLKQIMTAALLLIGLATATDVKAQQSWKGTDKDAAVGNTVFLYNVGTGRFLVHGGDWGTQARLFNADNGKTMTPTLSDGRYILKTGVNTGAAAVLGCNVPEITSSHAWKGNNDQETFTILMDANENYSGINGVSGQRNWNFIPVEDGDNITYYMYEELGSSTTTNYCYISYTSGSTTYYLNHNARFVAVSGEPSSDYWWLLQRYSTTSNYYYVYYNNGSTQTWLTASSQRATTSTSTSGRLYYFNGHIVDDQNNNSSTYYLKGSTSSTTAPSVTSGTTSAATASMQSETTGGTKYWLGAAYGENGPENAISGEGHEGDPVGKLCLLASGFDKAVWSTADPRTTTEYPCQLKSAETAYLTYDDADAKTVNRSMATEVRVFNADTYVPLNDLYKWRIVTEDQFLATLTESDAGDGLSTNLTWMITDRGFERSDNTFFDSDYGWKTGRVSGVSYNTTGRYAYTWGLESQGTNQQSTRKRSEPWNAPVRLKTEWVDKTNAKYGFMEFEGAGTVSTYIEAPATGVYKISCYGFYQGAHEGYLFATTTNPQGTTAVDPTDFTTIALEPVSTSPYRNVDKDEEGNATRANGAYSGSGVMFAGATFVNDFPGRDAFYREIQISLNKGQKVYFGVGKNGATRSSADVSGYYHDTEYVGVDQFNIYYLGTNPVWFDEEYTSLDYLDESENGVYTNQSIRLKRKFNMGNWNTFVFPIDLSAAQVRKAFGDGTRLAVLDGLGTQSGSASVIDFVSVSLPNEGRAIEADKFYLIKPQNEPTTGKDDNNQTVQYYDLGRASFNSGADGFKDVDEVSYQGDGTYMDIVSKGTYVAGGQAPANSYVVSNNKMYHIKTATNIKGFRGWIENTTSSNDVNITSLSLNGVIDGMTDSIIEIQGGEVVEKVHEGVYDLSGRRMANSTEGLSRGMYIVNGKKYLVK